MALTFCKLLLSIILIVIDKNYIEGSRIRLATSSASIIPLLTTSLNLRCSLEDTPSSASLIGRSLDSSMLRNNNEDQQDISTMQSGTTSTASQPENVKFVTSMFLYLDNKDIASLSEHVPAKAIASDQNLKVSGEIPGKNGEKGFLEVNIAYPEESQVGNFTCEIHAIDDVGHAVVYSTSVNIDVKEPTTIDLVKYIHQQQLEITQLKQQNNDLQTALDITNHIENGTVICGELGAGRPQTRRFNVTFSKPYGKVPLVHLAIRDTGAFKDNTSYFYVNLVSSGTTGFEVECRVSNQQYYVNHVTISWMSFPQH